jgi:hypothetical protein
MEKIASGIFGRPLRERDVAALMGEGGGESGPRSIHSWAGREHLAIDAVRGPSADGERQLAF